MAITKSKLESANFMDITALRKTWRTIFDPNTDRGTAKDIRDLLGREISSGLKMEPASEALELKFFGQSNPYYNNQIKGQSRLSSDTQIMVVMSRGFSYAGYFYPELVACGVCTEKPPVFIGFSSGMYPHNTPTTFSDGSSFTGKVMVTKEDLKAALNSQSILLIDDRIETRTTIVTLGRALRSQGLTGQIFDLDHSGYVVQWKDYIVKEPRFHIPKSIPIIIEGGRRVRKPPSSQISERVEDAVGMLRG